MTTTRRPHAVVHPDPPLSQHQHASCHSNPSHPQTPDSDRHEALVAIESMEGPWAVAGLPSTLPPGSYALRPGPGRQAPDWEATASLAWALERYSFLRYKDEAARKAATAPRRLVVPPSPAQEEAGLLAAAIYLARDLINTPAEDLSECRLAQRRGSDSLLSGALSAWVWYCQHAVCPVSEAGLQSDGLAGWVLRSLGRHALPV